MWISPENHNCNRSFSRSAGRATSLSPSTVVYDAVIAQSRFLLSEKILITCAACFSSHFKIRGTRRAGFDFDFQVKRAEWESSNTNTTNTVSGFSDSSCKASLKRPWIYQLLRSWQKKVLLHKTGRAINRLRSLADGRVWNLIRLIWSKQKGTIQNYPRQGTWILLSRAINCGPYWLNLLL